MGAENLDSLLRRALAVSGAEADELRKSAFAAPRHGSGRRKALILAVGTVLVAIVSWLSTRPQEVRQAPSSPASSFIISNAGDVVRVRLEDQTLIVGTGKGQIRPKAPHRLWISAEKR